MSIRSPDQDSVSPRGEIAGLLAAAGAGRPSRPPRGPITWR